MHRLAIFAFGLVIIANFRLLRLHMGPQCLVEIRQAFPMLC